MKNAYQVAEKAILEGFSNEIIAKITSLTVQEVQKIRLKITNKK